MQGVQEQFCQIRIRMTLPPGTALHVLLTCSVLCGLRCLNLKGLRNPWSTDFPESRVGDTIPVKIVEPPTVTILVRCCVSQALPERRGQSLW